MRMDVVTGGSDLLTPLEVPAGTVAATLGTAAVPVRAYWLARPVGRFHHADLPALVEEGTLDAFAAAVAADYGRRHPPLLIFPHLSETRDPDALAILAAIASALRCDVVALHDLTVETARGPHDGLARLAEALGDRLQGCRVEAQPPRRIDAGNEVATPLYVNACANRAAPSVAEAWRGRGFRVDETRLAAALARRLSAWAEAGRTPLLPLDPGVIVELAGGADPAEADWPEPQRQASAG